MPINVISLHLANLIHMNCRIKFTKIKELKVSNGSSLNKFR